MTTGKYHGQVNIGNMLDGKWHGTRFARTANGEKYITQYVNGEAHGTEACIASNGTLWLYTLENGEEKSRTKGWCRNYMCPNVYILVHTVQHTFWM